MPSLLIVTAAFPPSRLIGGRRPLRMARGLTARGWSVTVLTLADRYMQPVDVHAPDPEGIEVIRTHAAMLRAWLPRTATATSVPAPATPPRRAPTLRGLAGRVLTRMEFPDGYVGWLPFALAALRGRKFDVVLATLPPSTDGLVGALAARHVDGRLVLDYRDPWSEVLSPDGSYGVERAVPAAEIALHRKLEERILRQADLVLALTPRIAGWLSARTPSRVEFLPNGLDDVPPIPPLPRDQPARLVYAGSLAYERTLQPVVQALQALRDRYSPQQVRLTYAGADGARLRAAAVEAKVAEWLDDLGEIPAAQARALYRGATAGIVSVSPRTDYSYPGKLFEVLAAGCPIWLCGPPDCDAAHLVRQLQAGEVDDGTDRTHSARVLARLLTAPPAPVQGIEPWLATSQMQRLDVLLRTLLA
jgi:glycosyltransferase involved in cell wall biosynthesis